MRVGGVVAGALVLLQGLGARYRVEQLECAAFTETVVGGIRGESGTGRVTDRAGRDGTVVVVLRDSAGRLALEAWYDTVSVWRETSSGREAPDTDGFVGGRYRGDLGLFGEYRPAATPFVPDDVAQVADLAGVMLDFLPRLPAIPLAVGQEWTDGERTIKRLADGREQGRPTLRFSWTRTARHGERLPAGDSLAVTLDQILRETGELVWSERFGPLSWTRRVSVTARIPATGGVKRPLRTIVDQEIAVVRRFEPVAGCPVRRPS